MIQKYFNIIVRYKEHKWIEACLRKRMTYKNCALAFKLSHLSRIMNETTIVNNLVAFCLRLLGDYGAELSVNLNKPANSNEYISYFVSEVLIDMFSVRNRFIFV